VSVEALRRFDARSTLWLRQLTLGAFPRRLLPIIAHSGDSLVLVPALLVLWWLEGFSRDGGALALAGCYALTVVFTAAVKFAVRRRRPPGEWGTMYRRTDPHSFPSGHASRTMGMAVLLLARVEVLPGAVLLGWSFLVGLSRIILGVHYVLDVLAGYLLGGLVALAVWALLARGWPF
jgi:undecaprenyl-diphosphatase